MKRTLVVVCALSLLCGPPALAALRPSRPATPDAPRTPAHTLYAFELGFARVEGLRTRPAPSPVAVVKAQGKSAPVAVTVREPVVHGDVWARLRNCESSDGRTSASGRYHGYFQFSMTTWRSAGGTGHPMDHSYEYQKRIAQGWLARTSWAQWPSCSRQLGLR